MDKNTIIGIVLIVLIFVGWQYWARPSQEQIEAAQRQRDSLYQVELARQFELEKVNNPAKDDFAAISDTSQASEQARNEIFGLMSPYIDGELQFYTLENEKIKMTFSNKGGKIYSVELKDYKRHDGDPLILFDGNDNKFGFPFVHNTRNFNTNDLYFDIKSKNDSSIIFELNSGQNEFLAFVYELPKDEYMSRFFIQTRNAGRMITPPRGAMEFAWEMKVPSFEKGKKFEQQYSSIYYKYTGSDVDWLKVGRDGSEEFRTKMDWVAFKSQFFSSIFIAGEGFSGGSISRTIENNEASPFLSYNKAEIAVPMESNGDHVMPFHFYFGPNHYYTLNGYDKNLELTRLMALGWGILGWINKYAVIPVFHYLENYIVNYGIIILILTILLKIVIFPLTYKSYLSTAKMKVLKPQIDEINAKIPADKTVEPQQATMALYKKCGVNPMGGCLPMLLQMPILFAVFRFLPASIELRQKSFLWAEDLSAYDSICNLPFNIPFYGDHISLFTLLMAAVNVIYTHFNMQTQATTQMPGMKTMMYLMPVMFLFFFNSFASGLTYYYFVSTLITVLQTIAIKQFVNEGKLLAQLNANQKKPVKKSRFAQQLELAAKQQSQMKSKQNNNKKR